MLELGEIVPETAKNIPKTPFLAFLVSKKHDWGTFLMFWLGIKYNKKMVLNNLKYKDGCRSKDGITKDNQIHFNYVI